LRAGARSSAALTAGDYDLSLASVLSLSAMVTALLNVNQGCPWPGRARGAGCAALVGVGKRVLVAVLELDSFITTLGTGAFVSGLVLWISGSETVGGISDSLVNPVIGWDLLGIHWPSGTGSSSAPRSGTCSTSLRWGGGCCSPAEGAASHA